MSQELTKSAESIFSNQGDAFNRHLERLNYNLDLLDNNLGRIYNTPRAEEKTEAALKSLPGDYVSQIDQKLEAFNRMLNTFENLNNKLQNIV